MVPLGHSVGGPCFPNPDGGRSGGQEEKEKVNVALKERLQVNTCFGGEGERGDK